MTEGDRRAHPSPAIPVLLIGTMSVLALVAAILAVALGGPPGGAPSSAGTSTVDGDTVPVVHHLGPTSFTGPGPFAAGETTMVLPSDGALVEVWYPADPASAAGKPEARYNVEDWLPPAIQKLLPAGYQVTYPSGGVRGIPVAQGRFPLVLFLHGYSGFRDQSTFLTARLATWGFVVAAPDLIDHDLTAVLAGTSAPSTAADVAEGEDTISLMDRADESPSGRFSGRVDMGRIATVGHSLGGAVAEELAAADPRVTTFIGLAGASAGALSSGATTARALAAVPDKPGMLMVGTRDEVVGVGPVVRAFHLMDTPKRLVTIRGAGHLVFADICEIDRAGGGLLGAARVLHITVPATLQKLATDGCKAPDLRVTEGWPVIRQAVTAQLRHVFGFDASSAGLDGLAGAFPQVGANVSVTG